jgi:hypothetical protein
VVVIAADDILGAGRGPPLVPANRMHCATWILAALVAVAMVGCDRDRESTAEAPTSATGDATGPGPAAPVAAPDIAAPEAAPPQLAVGDRLVPITTRAADGTEGCGPCRLGKAPRLLVFGTTAGLARAEIWRDLDAMARLYGDNGLHALAIVVAHADGRASPITDAPATATAVGEVKHKTRVAMAVDVATGPGAALEGITTDPCVVLVDGTDAVRFVGGAGPHWRELDLAIGSVIAAP